MATVWVYDVDSEAFTLQWREISGARRYELQWHDETAAVGEAIWASGSARVKSTIARKKGLEPGHAYSFRVRGIDELGEALPGGFSVPTEALKLAPSASTPRPPPPRLSTADAESITVVWPEAEGVLFHAQMRMAGAGEPWVTCSDKLSGQAMRKRKLVDGAKYEFRVCAKARAEEECMWGAWSAPSAPLAVALLAPCFARLLGPQLLGPGAQYVPSERAGGGLMLLYFSAHWCPPCRSFTPQLADFYRSWQQQPLGALKQKLEVVFISCDRDAHSFGEYFAEQPWLAINYTAKEREAALAAYQVQGIPCLKVFGPTGKLLCENAVGQPLNDATVRRWEAQM